MKVRPKSWFPFLVEISIRLKNSWLRGMLRNFEKLAKEACPHLLEVEGGPELVSPFMGSDQASLGNPAAGEAEDGDSQMS